MNLKFVETFLLAAQLRSFSRTAEQLHTTLAAVSARIQNLEEELGAPLFDRSGRQLRLTGKGLELLPLAEKLVRAADEFEGRAKDQSGYSGRVRLGIIDTAANAILAPFLREVEGRLPKVEIDLQADTSQRIVERMVEGEIDLGITLVGLAPPGALSRGLLSLACHWVAAPSLVPDDREMTLAELASHAILSFAQGSTPHELTRAMLAQVGGARRLYCGTSLATNLRLAKEGFGISVMPAALVQDELAAGSLRLVRCAPPFRALDIQLSYPLGPGSHLLAALADALVDVTRTYCAQVPQGWAWGAPD